MRRFVAYGPALVVLMTVMVVLFAAPSMVRRFSLARTEASLRLAQHSLDDDDILERLNAAVRNVAKAVEPSVVHIDARKLSGGMGPGGSTGSGWVYDIQGHVITNAHVVDGATAIRVQFSDGRLSSARLVAADAFTDIAVIRVNQTEGLFPARRATNIPLEQGDRVFAFGSPFGFKFSMSEGIVSGLGRSPSTVVDSRNGYTNFIQTDAAVNPGNSGGPLADVKGRVVGMNVAIATGKDTEGTTEGQSAGISFAIPLATIESVVEQLIANGRVARGYLGIQYDSRSVAEARGGEGFQGTGVRITTVVRGGPADDGGLRPNDIVFSVNGQRVTDPDVLRSMIAPARPGENLLLDVWRDGARLSLLLKLGQYPEQQLVENTLLSYGMRVFESNDRLTIAAEGPWSRAYRAGFRSGQVITHVDGQEIKSMDDFMLAVAKAGVTQGRASSLTVIPAGGGESSSIELNVTRQFPPDETGR